MTMAGECMPASMRLSSADARSPGIPDRAGRGCRSVLKGQIVILIVLSEMALVLGLLVTLDPEGRETRGRSARRISSYIGPEVEDGLTGPPQTVWCQAFDVPHPDSVHASADNKSSLRVNCDGTDSAAVSADLTNQSVSLHVIHVKWAFVSRASNGPGVAGNQILAIRRKGHRSYRAFMIPEHVLEPKRARVPDQDLRWSGISGAAEVLAGGNPAAV